MFDFDLFVAKAAIWDSAIFRAARLNFYSRRGRADNAFVACIAQGSGGSKNF